MVEVVKTRKVTPSGAASTRAGGRNFRGRSRAEERMSLGGEVERDASSWEALAGAAFCPGKITLLFRN